MGRFPKLGEVLAVVSIAHRVRDAWGVIRGKKGVVVPLPETPLEPEAHRPDPTAKFNVFRVHNGELCLLDPQRYSGNDFAKAANAFARYRLSTWEGTVYLFVGDDVQERVVR